MLTRTLGLLVGLGLVAEGLYAAANPKSWSEQAAQWAEDYLPAPVKSSCLECTRLSPDTIRMMGVSKLAIGWMMLKLTRR